MFLDLTGRIAVVTGAGQGIGEAIARRLASAGAHVVIWDLRAEASQAVVDSMIKGGFAVELAVGDVTDEQSVRSVIGDIISRLGRIDILVNNAGIAGRAAPIWDLTDDDWNKVIDLDLTAVFRCCRAVIGNMRENGSGAIVNVASISGKEGNPNMIPYSVAKAGVIGLTKALAKEVCTQGIRVNCVAPAVIETPILQQLTPEQVAYMCSKIPMGRTGTTEEVAAVVHFLASDDASFVTGQCYDVSGGRATY